MPQNATDAKRRERPYLTVEEGVVLSLSDPLLVPGLAEDQAEKAKQIEDAKARQGFTQEMIEDAERELTFMKDNRLSRDMSVSDMKEIYPDIAEEVETEIENREWFKDTLSK